MPRVFSLPSLIAAITIMLAACGGTAAPAPSSAPAKPSAAPASQPAPASPAAAGAATFKFATGFPETDFSAEGLKHWADQVNQRTSGRVQFRFFWAGSLLTTTTLFQGIRDGLADFGDPATSFVSGQVPDVAPFEVPFAYPLDGDHTLPFYREVEPVINDVYSASGHQQVLWMPPSTTSIPSVVSCKNKFLDSSKAWSGALIRAAGKWQSTTLQAWGAKPVVTDLSEAYSAIQRGTADCLLFPYGLLDSFKMYEVAKNLTRIDHSVNLSTVTVNSDVLSKISGADQQVLKDAGRETEDFLMQQRSQFIDKTIAHLQQQSMKMCTPSQQELQRLRQATEPVLAEIAKMQTDKGKQLQDIAAKYRAQVTKLGPTQGDTTPCQPAA